MKTIRYARAGAVEVGDLSYSRSLANIYWATFRRLPSIVKIHIDDPLRLEACKQWALDNGFLLEAAEIKWGSGRRRRPGYPPWSQDDESNFTELFTHRQNRAMLSATTRRKNLDINLVCGAERWSWALKATGELCLAVGEGNAGGKIRLLSSEHGDFFLAPIEIEKPQIDLELNYGEGFSDLHGGILSFLNSGDPGLVLLHGTTGSGKSTYVYYLIHCCQRHMIFIPNNMVVKMADPAFIPFLLENAMDAVLIIEDAEKVLLERGEGDDSGVSVLLNLTDGLLAKVLKCKAVCTFNIERTRLDKALIRKGRLRYEHEFNALGPDHANKLLEKLGKEWRTQDPITLAEIYNDVGGYASNRTRTEIGFKRGA